MAETVADAQEWAEILLEAERERRPIRPFTDEHPDATVVDGYAVQDALISARVAGGNRLVGAKLGLTSRAKQQSMGVHEVVHAWLTDDMAHGGEDPLDLSRLIAPRVEPEIAFVLGAELKGPGVTPGDVLASTRAVCAALEVLDSRYEAFRFRLPDVVADNASAARFVLGSTFLPPHEIDLRLEACLLEVDGELVATACGAAALGDPAQAVAELANVLARDGRSLEAGSVILSGGLTEAFPLRAGGHVVAAYAHLGIVSLRAGAV